MCVCVCVCIFLFYTIDDEKHRVTLVSFIADKIDVWVVELELGHFFDQKFSVNKGKRDV